MRSFADGNGDGIGDLAGVRSRLPYLRDLGIDAIWFTPWYPSPMADGGYDVADYRDIDPMFGTLAEAEGLIDEAAALGIRVIVDVVPNHCSDRHVWFQRALAAQPGSHERARFWFRPGRGENGELPPNEWSSIFGGSAWTRTQSTNGTPGEWYLHLFAPQQPDLNWDNDDVRYEYEQVLRFWFDRGVAGVRIDSAALLFKDTALPDFDPDDAPSPHPFSDRDELHDVYRSWRALADAYGDDRILIGEIWLPDVDRFARYLRPDEMHSAFNFDFLACPWAASRLRACIDSTLAAHAPVGAPATWVLSNHDVTRPATRYGREDTTFRFAAKMGGIPPVDLELGTRLRSSRSRCRARPTSTKAKSSACRRSRTYPTRCCRTRCSSGPEAPTRGATGVVCLSPGRVKSRRSALAPPPRPGTRGSPSRLRGAPTPRSCRSSCRTRCSRSTGKRSASGEQTRSSVTARCAGSTRPRGCWHSLAAPASAVC